MSVYIHHGPPGSYKTSAAVQEVVTRIIDQPRTLITNIRGLDIEAIREKFGKRISDGFAFEFVDTDQKEGRERLARFFHWAPKGAFFVIDEAQRVFRPDWKASDLSELDYPGGPIAATAADRPETYLVAWDMHRHHNWDFMFTSTNIKKIRSEIREISEIAVRHVNMAVVGIPGFYKEIKHDAENSGTSVSQQLSSKFKRVPRWVFKLYRSTTTGKTSDTQSRSPIYKDPKILGLLLALGGLYFYLFFQPTPKVFGGPGSGADAGSSSSSSPSSSTVSHPVSSGSSAPGVPGRGASSGTGFRDPLDGVSNLRVTGSFSGSGFSRVFFEGVKSKKPWVFNSAQLFDLGYVVRRQTDCVYELRWRDVIRFAYCEFDRPEPPAEVKETKVI